MIKKLFLLIAILSCAAGVSAQHAPGSWRVLPMSAMDFEAVKETPDKVYYVTGGALYAYDKENNETEYYTPGSKLSDSGVAMLKYNKDEKYLMCVYDNCNIDLIYDSGKVVNLPEIKDANLTSAKAVNHIYFGKGRIYVATSFGIVVFDDQKHHVVESGIYNTPINFIAEMGDNIIIAAKNLSSEKPNTVYLGISPKADRHNVLSKFKPLRDVGLSDWLVVSDNSYIAPLNGKLWKVTINADNNVGISDTGIVVAGTDKFENYKDGYYLKGSSQFIMLDKEGNQTSRVDIPADFRNQHLSFWNSPATAWAADKDGIGNYDLSQTTPTVLSEKYFPQSSKQFNNAFVAYTPDGQEVYFNGIGLSGYHPSGKEDGSAYNIPILTESYNWNTGLFTPRYPTNVTEKYSNYQKLGLLYGGPGPLVVDPIDPSFVYTANNFDGLIVLKDGEVYYRYYKDNSPIYSHWGTRVFDVTLDNNGNLWVGSWHFTQGIGSPYVVLPKESMELLKKNPKLLEEKENNGQYKYWLYPDWAYNDVGNAEMKMIFSSHSNKALKLGNLPTSSLTWIGYDTKGSTSVNDDSFQIINTIADQDNNALAVSSLFIIEDKKGSFWIGTKNGILVVDDLNQLGKVNNTTLYVRRPKVARNDGTNFADYLLDSENVLCIAVDSNNKKWIGTASSGLFYVNEDGTEILAEYRTDNSPLLSNTITMLACDPHGNDVLIGTPEGLFVYSSDSAPAAEDYSDVYAYPNPVRPDYTGWIIINGLMDKSLVKIADQQGNVIWSGKSEGGMAQWDGCDAAGNRVRSGVYLVMASQNATGSASGAVAKIVVIN